MIDMSTMKSSMTSLAQGSLLNMIESPIEPTLGNFDSIESMKRFLYAGKAIITLVDRKRNQRFTYKVNKPSKHSDAYAKIPFFVGLLTGPDNHADYTPCGFIKAVTPDGSLKFFNGRKMSSNAPSVVLFQDFWNGIHAQRIPEHIEPLHANFCARCARQLTHPDSIKTGIGPECIGKL